MDPASKNRLSKVHPLLAERVAKTIADLAAQGLDVRVVQGLRTYAEQDALFAQGRTRRGPKVTNARGGQSNHNFGLAVDLCPFDDGVADWDNDRAFTLIGAAGKKNGLEWGGDWTSFPDRPHLQLKTGMKTAACHELAVAGGLARVWAEANQRLGVKPPAKLLSENEVTAIVDQFQEQGHAEPGQTNNPPIEQPASPVAIPDESSAIEKPVEKPADPAPQPQQQNEPVRAEAAVEIRKERPSLFVRITTAIGVAVSAVTTLGISVESIFNRSMDILQTSRLAPLVLGMGFGILAMWLYDRSAQRSNNLNQQKIANAADKAINTVELT